MITYEGLWECMEYMSVLPVYVSQGGLQLFLDLYLCLLSS